MLDLLLGGARRRFLDGRSDVAAAYSLLRLTSAYRGPLVRVRRSSDNLEADFGIGRGDVDWSAVAGFIGNGNSGFVSKWYDQSGLARDLAQAIASQQPKIGLLSNGLAGLTFDGVDDMLVVGSFTVGQPDSFLVVYRQVSQTQTGSGLQNVFDGLTANRQALLSSNGAQLNRMFSPGGSGNSTLSDDAVVMPLGVRGVVSGLVNGASSGMEISSALIESFNGGPNLPGGSTGLDGLTLAGQGGGTSTRFDNIEMQEFALFNTAHPAAQMQADNAARRIAWRF